MSDQSKTGVRVDIGVGAKAEIKTEIPTESSGRLLDALTDIIRPFSERRGLKADQIRLQREDVLIEIAKKARVRLEISGDIVQPISNKILVPLLEKASLEDLNDNYMIDRWAQLLAEATKYNSVAPRYIQILSELRAIDARTLEKIAKNRHNYFKNPYVVFENSPRIQDRQNIRSEIKEFSKIVSSNTDINIIISEFVENFVDSIERPGSAIFKLQYFYKEKCYSLYDNFKECINEDDFESVEILSSLGLINYIDINYAFNKDHSVEIGYYCFTNLGCDFYVRVSEPF